MKKKSKKSTTSKGESTVVKDLPKSKGNFYKIYGTQITLPNHEVYTPVAMLKWNKSFDELIQMIESEEWIKPSEVVRFDGDDVQMAFKPMMARELTKEEIKKIEEVRDDSIYEK